MPFDIGGFVYNTTFIQDYGKSGVVTDGLVLNLDAGFAESYPKGGTTWYDLSGNGYNATLVNGPTYSTLGGGSIRFDGSNDYATLTSIDFRRNFTMEAWVYYDNGIGSLFGQGTTSVNNGLHIVWQSLSRGLVFAMYGNDLDYSSFSTADYNQWKHLVFTYNHSTYLKQIYQNGTLIASGTGNGYTGTGTFRLGVSYSSGNYNYLKGYMAIARSYFKVLSSSEVSQNYNATKGRYGL